MSKRINDRGAKKWATSFMLPEHVEMLNGLYRDYHKQDKPILDMYQIEEFEEKIHYAREFHLPLTFTVWSDGFSEELTGSITRLNEWTKEVWVQKQNNDMKCIKFIDIIGVKVEE
ncbi:hypothetical protein CVD25_15315 [Bacillus canaveralius]|uniref:YolD-like family protein n=1 Tax=Bacillus canaveralius TaxID=1403243 RepID=A0A2N5GK81_9BACI|nr:YolD-like family protein [Bacillus canaveralius]PLR81836.1 hypothetical protein CU635_13840 [Bacillus canaveralius]PLR94990.1 hypothetical protein CVD25_15315 [Bacillus canaveralius]